MKCKLIFGLPVFCAFILSAADIPSKSLTLELAWELAEQHQPRIAEAKALVEAADGRTKQAGTFPNPEAIVRGESLPVDGKGRGEYLAGVSQPIPIGGSRAKAREAEKQDHERLKSELEVTRRDVRKKVHSAFATALYQAKAYDAFMEIAGSAEKAVSITQARVNAGDALPGDLARIEMDSARIQTELRRTKALKEQSLMTLATAIGKPELQLGSLDGSLETTFDVPSLESLAQNVASHPAAVSAEAEINRQRARLELAKAQRIPNVNVELLYRRIPSERRDAVDIGFSFPLPVFDRKQGTVQEAKAEISAAEARARTRKNDLALSLNEADKQLTAALDNARVMKTEILPRAEKVLKAAEARYENGDIGLGEILPIRREWAESHLAYLETFRDVMLAWANLSAFLKTN